MVVVHIPSDDQIVDVLTNPLPKKSSCFLKSNSDLWTWPFREAVTTNWEQWVAFPPGKAHKTREWCRKYPEDEGLSCSMCHKSRPQYASDPQSGMWEEPPIWPISVVRLVCVTCLGCRHSTTSHLVVFESFLCDLFESCLCDACVLSPNFWDENWLSVILVYVTCDEPFFSKFVSNGWFFFRLWLYYYRCHWAEFSWDEWKRSEEAKISDAKKKFLPSWGVLKFGNSGMNFS